VPVFILTSFPLKIKPLIEKESGVTSKIMIFASSPLKNVIAFGIAATLLTSFITDAFTVVSSPTTIQSRLRLTILQATNPNDDDIVSGATIDVQATDAPTFVETFVSDAKTKLKIYQKSNAEGYSFKQNVASALAGEYDATSINAELDELIQSAPCVMFTWESSPACKKAVQGFDSAGAKVKIVRLDNPWSEGNILRAELGKRVGRSSVPCIFIGKTYVGGFDDGVSDESPGIMKLAFEGKLRSMLDDAGAM